MEGGVVNNESNCAISGKNRQSCDDGTVNRAIGEGRELAMLPNLLKALRDPLGGTRGLALSYDLSVLEEPMCFLNLDYYLIDKKATR